MQALVFVLLHEAKYVAAYVMAVRMIVISAWKAKTMNDWRKTKCMWI